MIEVNRENEVLALHISGKLSEQEFDALALPLREYVQQVADPHLLMIMEHFTGWKSTAAFWKDIKLDVQYIGKFERIAIAGDRKWQQWATRLLNPLTRSRMRFFDLDDTDEAWNWIENMNES